jgi:hypothetical protein
MAWEGPVEKAGARGGLDRPSYMADCAAATAQQLRSRNSATGRPAMWTLCAGIERPARRLKGPRYERWSPAAARRARAARTWPHHAVEAHLSARLRPSLGPARWRWAGTLALDGGKCPHRPQVPRRWRVCKCGAAAGWLSETEQTHAAEDAGLGTQHASARICPPAAHGPPYTRPPLPALQGMHPHTGGPTSCHPHPEYQWQRSPRRNGRNLAGVIPRVLVGLLGSLAHPASTPRASGACDHRESPGPAIAYTRLRAVRICKRSTSTVATMDDLGHAAVHRDAATRASTAALCSAVAGSALLLGWRGRHAGCGDEGRAGQGQRARRPQRGRRPQLGGGKQLFCACTGRRAGPEEASGARGGEEATWGGAAQQTQPRDDAARLGWAWSSVPSGAHRT